MRNNVLEELFFLIGMMLLFASFASFGACGLFFVVELLLVLIEVFGIIVASALIGLVFMAFSCLVLLVGYSFSEDSNTKKRSKKK